MKLYLATLEITRGMNEESYTYTHMLGIFDDFQQAEKIAIKEFDKYVIPDSQVKNVQNIWDKYKKLTSFCWYEIPKGNKEEFYAELDRLNLKDIYEDESELLGATVYISITRHEINKPMAGTKILELCHNNKIIR